MTVEQRNAVQTVLNAGYAATVWPGALAEREKK
jgi:hypothetical protein